MLDTHLEQIKIIPESELNFQNIELGLKLQRQNRELKNIIYTMIVTSLIVITYYILKDEKSKED